MIYLRKLIKFMKIINIVIMMVIIVSELGNSFVLVVDCDID
jgi:hypothetical protein